MKREQIGQEEQLVKAGVFVLFSTFFFLDYLAMVLHLIPREFTWIPELISIVFLFYVLLKIFQQKKLVPVITQTHLVVFFIVFTVFGIVINQVDLPMAAAGLRNNLKCLPLFFLPFVFRFDAKFIRRFLIFLFFWALLQFPVTLIQRIVYSSPWGDVIGGSLGDHSSGILSVFLTLSLGFWSFYFLKNRLKVSFFIPGFFALVIPMGLNETKVVFFIIPAAFLGVFLFTPNKKELIRKMVVVFLCFVAGLVLIGSLYNYLYTWKDEDVKIWQEQRKAEREARLAQKEKRAQKTLPEAKKEFGEKKSEEQEVDPPQFLDPTKRRPSRHSITKYLQPENIKKLLYDRRADRSGALNRVPQVLFAFDQIKKSPVHLLFGVGAGNASDSFFEAARGEYYKKHGDLNIGNNLLSRMLWEYGLVGTLLFFSIFIYFFIKIWKLRTGDDRKAVTASGFLVLIVIYFMTSIYFNTMLINLFAYLFWFMGGILMSLGESNG